MTSKLSHQVAGQWVGHSYSPEYAVEKISNRSKRLVIGLPTGDTATISEGDAGRYQSPSLTQNEWRAFMDRHAPFLSGDARFDLWVHSPSDGATVVIDRHSLAYAYGPIDAYLSVLGVRCFKQGMPNANFMHQHHYRAEFDADSSRLRGEYEWAFSPLRPEDEQ
jgi:hypothetical protein